MHSNYRQNKDFKTIRINIGRNMGYSTSIASLLTEDVG